MYKNEVVAILRELKGEFTTVQDEIRDMVIDLLDETGIDYSAEDFGEYVSIEFEDEDGNDKEVMVRYECTGRTYYITTVC